MKSVRETTLVVGFFLFFGVGNASAEVIERFVSEIIPATDGSFTVAETITYNFQNAERHGIFRDLPLSHPQEASEWYKKRYIEVEVQVVLQDKAPALYVLEDITDGIRIKIGDPDATITGQHTYEITYTVQGGLWYTDASPNPELYWNVTGHDWSAPIRYAEAHVKDVKNVLLSQRTCYAGWPGQTGSCQVVVATSTGALFVMRNLEPGQGMTIAQALKGNQVAIVKLEETIVWIPWVLGGVVWLLLLIFGVYRYRTAHKPAIPEIPQYEPLPDFKPMFTGVLFDGRLDARDITAGLIYLAEQGFITITKTEQKVLWVFEVDDYEITLQRPISTVETEFLREVLYLLFPAALDTDSNATMRLSDLKGDQSKQRANYKRVQALKQAVVKDLVEREYFEQIVPTTHLVVGVIAIVVALQFVFGFLLATVGNIIIPILVIGIGSVVILSFAYKRRTRKGYEALNHLKGFKDYLATAEKERYAFHNAPEKSPTLFMQYLPYAIAFGVEDKWAEVFKDVTLPNPSWYHDANAGTFSAVALTSDLGSFSSSFASSSGSSPSSGGGSSGGGAGGGGGGSW